MFAKLVSRARPKGAVEGGPKSSKKWKKGSIKFRKSGTEEQPNRQREGHVKKKKNFRIKTVDLVKKGISAKKPLYKKSAENLNVKNRAYQQFDSEAE